jgi:hypothetical protein
METKVNIISNDQPQELVVREGSAIAVDGNPNRINITGTLRAPAQFLKDKKAGTDVEKMGVAVSLTLTESARIYNPRRSHVLVDRHKGSIVLVLNEKDAFEDRVTGVLKMFKDLIDLGINQEKRYSIDALIKVVKRNKFYFADTAQHFSFLLSLTNFNTKLTTEIKHARETNGSRLDMTQKVVNNNEAAPRFKLKMPIFEGYEPVTFEVEVVVDVTDVTASFTLESVDLFELEKSMKNQYIDEQTKEITDSFKCSVVEVG